MQIETHCHTWESSPCGKVKAETMVAMYRDKGYGMVVVTDHYASFQWDAPHLARKDWEKRAAFYLKGYRAAKQAGDRLGVKIGLGMELQFDGFAPYEFLIYGVSEEFIEQNPYLNKYTPGEFKKVCDENGFAMYQAHPYRFDRQPAEPVCYHGVEVVNGNPRHNSHNGKAVAFAAEKGLSVISGSDFHQPEDCAIGGIIGPDDIKDSRDLAGFLRSAPLPELIVTYEEDAQ